VRLVSLVAAALAAAIVAVPRSPAAGTEEEHSSIHLVSASGGQLREVVSDDAAEGPQLSLSWTRDGKALVYARSPCDGCSEIRFLRLAAKSSLGLIIGQGRAPRLGRDGRTLVYIGSDGGLYASALTGTVSRRVIPGSLSAGGIDQPDVSPDGRQIAFRRGQANGKWSIDVVAVAGGHERRLTPLGTAASNPAWSPDGRTIAFSLQAPDGRWRIALVRADGGGLRILPLAGSTSFPTWSPDGRRIAFVREGGSGDSIYASDLSGRHERRLTPAGMDAIQPAWSPRGDRIAFVENEPSDD
jgi:Tol biopolymer transport system component